MEHRCKIGLLHHYEYSELVTLNALKAHIINQKEHNLMVERDPVLRNAKELYVKAYELKDYGDRRKSTDLTRFDYCPYCGKNIDWCEIRKTEVNNNE